TSGRNHRTCRGRPRHLGYAPSIAGRQPRGGRRAAMILTRISVANPVFATMLMVALLVFGLFSYQRLAIEQFPDIDLPVVAVVVSYPGASPEAVENDVVRPIEDAVNTLSGIDAIQSTARQGQAMVVIQFEMEVNSSTAA